MPSAAAYLNQLLTEFRESMASEFHNMLWKVAQELEEAQAFAGLMLADELLEKICDLTKLEAVSLTAYFFNKGQQRLVAVRD